MALRTKIIVLLLLSIIPVALVVLNESIKDRNVVQEQVGASSLEYARLSLQRINEYLYSKLEDVRSFSYIVSRQGFANDQRRRHVSGFLEHITQTNDEYYYIVLLDTDGDVIAADKPSLIGANLSTEPGCVTALTGQQQIQDVSFNEAAGDYAVIISMPVTMPDDTSIVTGVICAAVKWSKISEMIGTLKIANKPQSLADHLMLINSQGLVISCFDQKRMFKTNLIDTGSKPAQFVIDKKEGFVHEGLNEHGVPSFTVYTYQKKYKDMPNLGWALLFHQDPQRVFASLEKINSENLYTLMVYILVILIIWFIFINRVSKPILALASAAQAVGRGDLTRKIPVVSKDELGTLANSFNSMVEDLKNSRIALDKSQENYRVLVESAGLAIATVTEDAVFTFMNNSAAQQFGGTPADYIGKNMWDLFPRNHADRQMNTIKEVLESGQSRITEEQTIIAGKPQWYDTRIQPLTGADGRFSIALCIANNITERKQMEIALRDSEERWRSLVESAPDLITTVDRDGKILFANRTVSGRAMEEVLGSSCFDLVAAEYHDILRETITKTVDTGDFNECELEVLAPDGTRIWFHFHMGPIKRDRKVIAALGVGTDIAQSKKTQEALLNSERRYRTLLHNIPGMIYRGNPDWTAEIIANSEAICGYLVEDLNAARVKWLDLIHPDDKERVLERSGKLENGGKSDIQVYRIIDKQGNVRWVEDHKRSQFAEDGSFEGVDGIVYDVTERKWAEQALRESEERYRTLFEGCTEGIVVVDAQARKFKYVNPAICKILGFDQEQFIRMGISDIHPPESLEYVFSQFEAQLRGEKQLAMDIPCLRKDGSVIYADIGATKVEIDGRLCMVGFFTDITDRKRAQDNLEKSEEKYRRLVESLEREYFFYSHNIDGVFTYISPSIENVLKYSQEEFQTHYSEFLTENPINKEVVRHSDLSIAGKIQPPYLVEIYDKDGAIHMLEVSESPILDEKGTVTAVDGIAHDITQLLRAKEELQKAHDELEARVQQRTADLAKLNKELRNEIAERKRAEITLIVYQEKLRSLASELSLSEERLRRHIATELHDHIGQNLAISKINLDSLCNLSQETEITKLLKQTSKLIAKTIESSRTLIFELSPPVLYELGLEAALEWLVRQVRQQHNIKADFESDGKPKSFEENIRVLLFQAVRELIINVVKHANAANIHVNASRIGEQIQIIVQDDGSGFDTSKLSPGESQTGGFGLFNIRERIENVGGKLELNSKRDKGTKVTLTAPLKNEKNV
ncbi:MAG: PAS domain S-box protein [Planctomycetota bacterium]|jgi:PAS domain S-box-containing protein